MTRARWMHIIVVTLMTGLLILTSSGYTENSTEPKAEVPEAGTLALGELLPAFPTEGKWFGGTPLTVEALKGKVTLLYFLSPGCPSCDAFSPHLLRLMLRHNDALQVVGITFATEQHAKDYARDAIAKHPVFHDADRSYTNRLIGKVNLFPYVAILDRDARLQWFGRAKFHAHVTREVLRVLDPEAAADADAALPIPPKQYALVIARSTAHRGTDLPAPTRDAADLATLLTPHFEEVVLLSDATGQPASRHPTPSNIRAALDRLAEQAGEEGAVLIYYAGDANLVLLQGRERVDLMLAVDGSAMMINHFSAILNRHHVGKRLMILDVNQAGRVFDDIEDALNAGVPDLPLLFSAARHDHSHLVLCPDQRETALFSFLLRRELAREPVSPEALFCRIRDAMSAWTRHDGRLQSPMQTLRESPYAAFRIRASEEEPAANSETPPETDLPEHTEADAGNADSSKPTEVTDPIDPPETDAAPNAVLPATDDSKSADRGKEPDTTDEATSSAHTVEVTLPHPPPPAGD